MTTDSGAGVEQATVLITRLPDRAVFRTRADRLGAFTVVVDDGTGDYMVYIAADSTDRLRPYRARVQRDSSGALPPILAVLRPPAPATLEVVQVTAERPAPERASNVLESGVGAVEQVVLGVDAVTMPEQRGSLSALAAATPGLTVTARGLAGLGAGVQTTLNGLAFPGATVPRDVRFSTRVSTSTFDPARGWFGGAETTVQIEPGTMLTARRASVTLDAPTLQGGDRLARPLGQQFGAVSLSAGGEGYTAGDRVAYNVGVEASHRTASLLPPTRLDADVLTRVGLAPDSAQRALGTLTSLGVPLALAGGAESRVATTSASMLARLNTPEFVARTNTPATHSLGLVLYAFREATDGVGAGPLALSTRRATATTDVRSAQLLYSTLSARRVMTSVRTALSHSRDAVTPRLRVPAGDVVVFSALDDATVPGALLGFGGAEAQSSGSRLTWETHARSSLYLTRDTRHLVELVAAGRFDQVDRTDADRPLGVFTFADLGALRRNEPVAFQRTLDQAPQRSGVWNGFISLSDTWRPTRRLRVIAGVRAEAYRFADQPAFNSEVAQRFGVRTDRTPGGVSVSPRLGFRWNYTRAPVTSGAYVTPLGTLPIVPTGVIRGGVGRFTGFMSPDLVAAAAGQTGLPGLNVELTCVGPAAPRPDWPAFATSPDAVPTACRATSQGTLLEQRAPVVQLVAPDFSVADSWRANLGWSARTRWATLSVDGTLAWNRHQASEVDLNFIDRPRFATADEARPVFVSPAAIVPTTGALSAVEARRSAAFGRVLETRSDLAGDAQQLIVTVFPHLLPASSTLFSSLSYTLGHSRSWQRGFDGATFGAPQQLERRPTGIDIRHTLLLQVGTSFRLGSVSLFGRFASGQPFTPLVDTDVNGDGRANDRAFVFDPAAVADAALAADLRALFAQAPSYARACLAEQLGRAAALNSCRGPWTATLNARLAFRRLRWRDAQIALAIFNVPAALDRLVHGSTPQGWGNPAVPDPILFRTRGFDPTALRYRYQVNPRFGDSFGSPMVAPFRINLDVRLELGPSESRQLVRRLLRPGRGGRQAERYDVPTLVQRLRRSGPQPYREMLELGDSLSLSAEQLATIARADEALRTRMDSVWVGLATWMASLPAQYDEATVVARQEQATDQVWEIARQDVQRTLRPLLSPQQVALLPWPADLLFTSTTPITGMRVFDYRDP